ncbi:phage head closure protein [Paenilisteria rocourtiae]|uniref:SPP1 family predicted phage head-tail adaptor n=1 Tax=Listeria rocourtiae TaxID=647910 RepID=A0A4R6ZIG3_9LIST|nr:phage head closure protein [Listeria rocourtiae]EUJ46671.1 phage head-tail adaptor [Listeria rocourtiae FSL F6-920]TDR51729.1 SPP1 family predicted phage head-tail adaptor [Listeria rocourtiae]
MQKVNHDYFNDGVLYYGALKTVRDDNRKRSEDIFAVQGKLFYQEMSVREQDYMLVNAIGGNLTLKIKTPYRKEAQVYQKVKIGTDIYDVITIDPDRNVRLFWYLEKSGDDNE